MPCQLSFTVVKLLAFMKTPSPQFLRLLSEIPGCSFCLQKSFVLLYLGPEYLSVVPESSNKAFQLAIDGV